MRTKKTLDAVTFARLLRDKGVRYNDLATFFETDALTIRKWVEEDYSSGKNKRDKMVSHLSSSMVQDMIRMYNEGVKIKKICEHVATEHAYSYPMIWNFFQIDQEHVIRKPKNGSDLFTIATDLMKKGYHCDEVVKYCMSFYTETDALTSTQEELKHQLEQLVKGYQKKQDKGEKPIWTDPHAIVNFRIKKGEDNLTYLEYQYCDGMTKDIRIVPQMKEQYEAEAEQIILVTAEEFYRCNKDKKVSKVYQDYMKKYEMFTSLEHKKNVIRFQNAQLVIKAGILTLAILQDLNKYANFQEFLTLTVDEIEAMETRFASFFTLHLLYPKAKIENEGVKYGQICWYDFGQDANLLQKKRPCVIVSEDKQNEIWDRVIVVPLTTSLKEKTLLDDRVDVYYNGKTNQTRIADLQSVPKKLLIPTNYFLTDEELVVLRIKMLKRLHMDETVLQDETTKKLTELIELEDLCKEQEEKLYELQLIEKR